MIEVRIRQPADCFPCSHFSGVFSVVVVDSALPDAEDDEVDDVIEE